MRSKAYPNIDLATAVRRVELYNTNLGSVGAHARDKVAVAIGYKGLSGPASRAIAALVHYGLLDRRKDKYGLSDLAKSILYPHEEGERTSALKEAATKPSLFYELTAQYANQELPSLLGNILTSPQYGINPKVKDEVVEIFKASLEYAGLINNGRVQPLDLSDTISEIEHEFEIDDQPQPGMKATLANHTAPTNVSRLTQLPSGIELAFPPTLGFAVLTGEFGDEIKKLENKAQAVLNKDVKGKSIAHEKEAETDQ